VEELKRRQLSPLPLLEAYRLYLVDNLSAPRCADDNSMMGNAASFGLDLGQAIDKEARTPSGSSISASAWRHYNLIQEEESTPARLEGVATGLRMCETPNAAPSRNSAGVWPSAKTARPTRPPKKNAQAWRAKVRDLLAALSRWQESALDDPTTTEHFREKSAAYSDLLNLVFNGPDRDVVRARHARLPEAEPVSKGEPPGVVSAGQRAYRASGLGPGGDGARGGRNCARWMTRRSRFTSTWRRWRRAHPTASFAAAKNVAKPAFSCAGRKPSGEEDGRPSAAAMARSSRSAGGSRAESSGTRERRSTSVWLPAESGPWRNCFS